jgi:hypothetical protein
VLLGRIVESVDEQAEQLTGSLFPSGPRGWSTAPSAHGTNESPAAEPAASSGSTSGPGAHSGRRAGPASRGRALQPAPLPDALPTAGSFATPSSSEPAAGARAPATQLPPPGETRPAAPASAVGAGAGFGGSPAVAALAGLVALALAALLGRLRSRPDLIRPLAFVSPPDRPG